VIQFVKYRKTRSQISRFSDNNINRVNYWLQRGLNKLEVNLAGWCDVHQTQAWRQEHSTHHSNHSWTKHQSTAIAISFYLRLR